MQKEFFPNFLLPLILYKDHRIITLSVLYRKHEILTLTKYCQFSTRLPVTGPGLSVCVRGS